MARRPQHLESKKKRPIRAMLHRCMLKSEQSWPKPGLQIQQAKSRPTVKVRRGGGGGGSQDTAHEEAQKDEEESPTGTRRGSGLGQVGCSLHLLQDSQLQAACVANLGPSLEAGTRGH